MTTRNFADVTLDNDTVPYEGRVTDKPSVGRKLVDPIWRALEYQSASFTLANADGALTPGYVADLAGRSVEIERYDQTTGYVLSRFVGAVAEAALDAGLLRISATSIKLEVLRQQIPKGIIDTTAFPKAVDVGQTPNVIFGNVFQVPLHYVREDTLNSQYDFLVGRGALGLFADAAGTKVYRSPERTTRTTYPVQASEYTLSTVLYAGYTALRFPRAQWDFNNARDTIYANVTGLQPERNFARALKTVLSDTTWGLGEPVDSASFAVAEAALNAVGSLFCDGVLGGAAGAVEAQQILRQLAMVRGMILGLNTAGAWTLTVDAQKAPRFVLGDGTGDGPRNLVKCENRTRPAPAERVKNVLVNYRRDMIADTLLMRQPRTVSSFGNDLLIDCDFIRDHTTADKVADYLSKRLKFNLETVDVSLPQEARDLVEGDLVDLTYTPLGYTASRLEVREFVDWLERVDAVLQGGDAALYASIFTYTPGTLPADTSPGTATDFTRTAPASASALTIVGQGVDRATNGEDTAYVILQYTAPTVNFAYAVPRFRKTGTTQWTAYGPVTTQGAGVQVKITTLSPGNAYDYSIQDVNQFGVPSLEASDPILANQLAPGDTTAPPAPAAGSATQSGARIVEVTFPFTEPADWAFLELYENTTNNSATATLVDKGKKKVFHRQNVAYGTPYFHWAKGVDLTGNKSAFSPVAIGPTGGPGITIVQIGGPDVAPGGIDTPQIANNAVVQGVTSQANNDVSITTASGEANMPNMSVSLLSLGKPIQITFGADSTLINVGADGGFIAVYRLYRDGVQIYQGSLGLPLIPAGLGAGLPLVTPGIWDVPGAGIHTYQMKWQVIFGTFTFHVYSRSLTAAEFRR